MLLGPKIFKVQNGQLKVKDQNIQSNHQPQPYKIIRYSHTVRPSPDDYHTEAIKQYKQENQQLRRKYFQLQKAYYTLLGYYQQNFNSNYLQTTPIHLLCKEGIYPNSTEMCESMSKSSSANVSSFQLQQIMKENEQSRKKMDRLSQSILQQQQIQDFRQKINQIQNGPIRYKINQHIQHHRDGKRLVKTEIDEDIQDLLMQAFREVQQLREILQQVKQNSSAQIQELKNFYQQKVQNLEAMLQKQRKQSRMLNGVINRMRQQLHVKQNFFKSVKEIKTGPERILLDKLLKQHKVLV